MSLKTIFKTELIAMERKRRKCKDDYPRFDLTTEWSALYPSLQQAEATLPNLIKDFKEQGWYELHSCRITEIPLDKLLVSDSDNYSERVYDENGVKLDERLFPTENFMSCDESTYKGRKPEEIRFAPGDVAQWGNELCVVVGFMHPYAESRKPYGDASDDGYTVWIADEHADEIKLDNDGYPEISHGHPQAVSLFPPRFPISDKMKRRIDNLRKCINHDKH